MDNEKYYTPDIKEFHVGFEFSYKPRLGTGLWGWVNNQHEFADNWVSTRFTHHSIFPEYITKEEFDFTLSSEPKSLDSLSLYIKHSAIRVKYLDREDIESLGWKSFIKDDNSNMYNYFIKMPKNYQYELAHIMYFPDDRKCYINFEIKKRMMINYPERMHDKFIGEIKNKSQLRQVMQMVGIIK